ncbi:MAG: molecular chaperone DnaJ [Prochlorococcaceae cyanobacterium]
MPQTTSKRSGALLPSRRSEQQGSRQQAPAKEQRGFGAGAQPGRGRGGKRGSGRKPALSKADWGPLGKHPDLDAIVARQRLQLPLSGRITVSQVNQAWKSCASEHHPDRGGEHDTMQLVNGARDLLLSRDLS